MPKQGLWPACSAFARLWFLAEFCACWEQGCWPWPILLSGATTAAPGYAANNEKKRSAQRLQGPLKITVNSFHTESIADDHPHPSGEPRRSSSPHRDLQPLCDPYAGYV